jgi:hypothetical protein
LASNLDHASEIRRLGGFFSNSTARATQGTGRRHGRQHGGARATVRKMKHGFFLHDLDYERNLFCPLTPVEPGHKKAVDGEAAQAAVGGGEVFLW